MDRVYSEKNRTKYFSYRRFCCLLLHVDSKRRGGTWEDLYIGFLLHFRMAFRFTWGLLRARCLPFFTSVLERLQFLAEREEEVGGGTGTRTRYKYPHTTRDCMYVTMYVPT